MRSFKYLAQIVQVYTYSSLPFCDVMNTEENSSDTGESTQDKEDERNDTADNDETGKSQKEIYEEVEIEINVAKKRGKTKIRCAKINHLAFIDIITDGWAMLKKKDLLKTRFAAKDRESRSDDKAPIRRPARPFS